MMPDDPAITIVVSAFFALFFFGVSIAMVFIDAKTIMYGPDLRGIS